MNKLLFILILWTAKLTGFLISALNLGRAFNVPGRVALKLDENFLQKFKIKDKCKIIFITGTNGKSTTCGLAANFLKTAGYKVVYNKTGANLKSGIASTLSKYSDIFGNLQCDYLLLEGDEAALYSITKDLKPALIAVTNLFRDQLDRFGELDTTAELISKGLNNQKATVLLNADDPRVAFLKTTNDKIYYGIDVESKNSGNNLNNNKTWFSDPEEVTTCLYCHSDLFYSSRYIGHMGKYKCSKCDFTRPAPTFSISDFKADHLTLNFNINSHLFSNTKNNFFLPLIGTFNLYNALCAISIAKLISNITPVQIQKGLQSYLTIFGRGEKITLNGKLAWIYLIKNPSGATEVLKTLSSIDNARFLIALNDNYADGRDVSWIWDARFDFLSNHKNEIYVSGKRAYDMALRLKYANINKNQIKVNKSLNKSIYKAMDSLSKNETLYILPTYTALLELQRKKISR